MVRRHSGFSCPHFPDQSRRALSVGNILHFPLFRSVPSLTIIYLVQQLACLYRKVAPGRGGVGRTPGLTMTSRGGDAVRAVSPHPPGSERSRSRPPPLGETPHPPRGERPTPEEMAPADAEMQTASAEDEVELAAAQSDSEAEPCWYKTSGCTFLGKHTGPCSTRLATGSRRSGSVSGSGR